MLSFSNAGVYLWQSAPTATRWVSFLLLFFSAASASAAPAVLRVAISSAETANVAEPSYYFQELLQLALAKTAATDGAFQIVNNHHGGGIERDRALLVAGVGIDVMWGSVTAERAAAMRVIPVDLLKTLNNYRVLLIRKDNQAVFNGVRTLHDLRRLTMGSGVRWTDSEIMSANGFTIVDGANYSGLFKMLAAGRFDFMSRGVHEVGYDLTVYANLGLALENHVLLKYSAPVAYSFYVNKNNLALANRLERGLRMAQEDGSFDQLFYRIPSLSRGMELFKNSQRTLLELKNDAVASAAPGDCALRQRCLNIVPDNLSPSIAQLN